MDTYTAKGVGGDGGGGGEVEVGGEGEALKGGHVGE